MTERIKKIFDIIPDCNIFADVACDHGYVAYEMLTNEKCSKAIVSDISEKCLCKAKKLLSNFIDEEKCCAILSDGFDNLPQVDVALIAGIGGVETIKILKKTKILPNILVLSPMKNVIELRQFLTKNNFKIEKDYTYYANKKFYNLILAQKGKDILSIYEIEFGRTNIKELPKDFVSWGKQELNKLNSYIERASGNEKDKLNKRIEMLKYLIKDKIE